MRKLNLDEETIRNMYINDGMSCIDISRKLGCSQGSVSFYLKLYGIKSRDFSRKGIPSWNKGTHIQTNTGRTHWKKGNVSWNKGKKLSKEHIKKLSDSHKGQISWMKGKKWEDIYSKEALKSFNNRFRIKENHPSWLGGLSFEKYGKGFTEELRERIREEYGRVCQECGYSEERLGYKLSVHHIDYNKKNNNETNLIPLCKSCHQKTNYDREDWIKYYEKL